MENTVTPRLGEGNCMHGVTLSLGESIVCMVLPALLGEGNCMHGVTCSLGKGNCMHSVTRLLGEMELRALWEKVTACMELPAL